MQFNYEYYLRLSVPISSEKKKCLFAIKIEIGTTGKDGRREGKIRKEVYIDFPSILSVYALWILPVNV